MGRAKTASEVVKRKKGVGRKNKKTKLGGEGTANFPLIQPQRKMVDLKIELYATNFSLYCKFVTWLWMYR